MSSLWKDLLFLHGHLAHKEDLVWSDQISPESSTATPPASAITDQAGIAAKGGAKASKACVSHWPHLAAPR